MTVFRVIFFSLLFWVQRYEEYLEHWHESSFFCKKWHFFMVIIEPLCLPPLYISKVYVHPYQILNQQKRRFTSICRGYTSEWSYKISFWLDVFVCFLIINLNGFRVFCCFLSQILFHFLFHIHHRTNDQSKFRTKTPSSVHLLPPQNNLINIKIRGKNLLSSPCQAWWIQSNLLVLLVLISLILRPKRRSCPIGANPYVGIDWKI